MNKYINQYRVEGDICYIDCFDIKGTCTNRENNCNKNFSRNPLSGHTGIRFNSKVGSYYVRIMVNKKEISLGHYNSLDAAIEARKQGEQKYFGKFMYQNKKN